MGYFHAAETRQRGTGWEFLYISYHSRAGLQSLQSAPEPLYSHLGCTCHTVLLVKIDRGWIARKRFAGECRRTVFPVFIFFPPQQHFISYILHFSSFFFTQKVTSVTPELQNNFGVLLIHHFFSFSYDELKMRVWVHQLSYYFPFTLAILLFYVTSYYINKRWSQRHKSYP